MGQYFVPVVISDRENPKINMHFYSHVYGSGLKLMEHSYVGNGFVQAVELVLALDGAQRVVWAGDYADPEPGTRDGVPLPNLYLMSHDEDVQFAKAVLVRTPALFTGIYAPAPTNPDPEHDRMLRECILIDPPFEIDDAVHRYVLNIDKQLYVDKLKAPPAGYNDLRIHPMPLLTAEGNGRGGGDYRADTSVIGSWARDRISIAEQVPEGYIEYDFAGLLPPEGRY